MAIPEVWRSRPLPEGGLRHCRASPALIQREVLQLVAEGMTVECHQSQIMTQLDFHATAELTKYVLVQGLLASE